MVNKDYQEIKELKVIKEPQEELVPKDQKDQKV